MPADNFFDIEDTSALDTEKVNDILFSDTSTVDTPIDEIEKIEDKKKEKKEEVKKEEVKKEPEKTEELDAAYELFGDPEEKKVEDKDKDEDEEKKDEEDDEESNKFEVISKELYTLGVFLPDEDEEGNSVQKVANNPEDFKNLFIEQKQKGMMQMLESYLGRFGDDRIELFQAIYENGVDPREYLPVHNQLQNLEGLVIEGNDINQERVVKEYYSRLSWDDDKIAKKIQKLKDTSDLEDEAVIVHEKLVEQDKQELKDQEEKNKQKLINEQRTDAEYKQSISRILTDKLKEKEFDGIPLTDKIIAQAFDHLYTKKYKTPDGKLLTELDKWILELQRPENHNLKVKLGLLSLSNLDLSKVQKKALTKETNTLFSQFATKKVKSEKTKPAPATSWDL